MTNPDHPNLARVRQALEAGGGGAAAQRIVEFATSTRTAAEAAAALGVDVAQIAKSLVFVLDGGGLVADSGVLVITSGANRVSETKVGALLGAPTRRATAEVVKRLTGYPVGGVPPVGHATTLRVLVDEDLLQYDEIWAAAGTPRSVFPIAPAALVRLTVGEVADVKEA